MAKEAVIRDVHVERYYPSVLAPAKEFKAIAEAENPEFVALWERFWKWHLNTFVYDLDYEGAARWESMLGIRPKATDRLDDRRKEILIKINSTLPYTHRRLEQMLNILCGAGLYELDLDYNNYNLSVVTNPDVTMGLNRISTLLRAIVPANLTLDIVIQILQQWKIHHTAEIMGVVDAHHNIWNFGAARTIRWDAEFNFDRSIRFGVYGDQYKDRQQHQAEILIIVEAWQRNLVPVNVFDGAFSMDGNHTWRGMSLQRLPLHKTGSQGIARAVHKDAAKISNQAETMSCPNIYLANPIKHENSNITEVDATYNTDYRTVNLADGSFCCDGSHAFDGTQQQNIADVTNYCTITRITKNGIGRIERV